MKNLVHPLHWHLSKARELPGIHDRIRELREEAHLTPQAWQKMRDERLRFLLAFAGKHVPYYRNVFRYLGFDPTSADLAANISRIPIITKDLVRERFEELNAANADRSHLLENATGGSTGVPLKFFQDRSCLTTAAAIDVCVREWWGIKPYDRTALVWGADREFHDLSLKERFYQWRSRMRSLNAFRMSDQSLLHFCRMLTRWRPPYLMGYSSALEALAECAKRHGVNGVKFKAIRSAAETLWPHQRRLIEETFQSPVFNFYGSREVNSIAAECPEKRRLHLISTWVYVEIVDADGNQVADGEPGWIVVTDLSNYAMPFIRYRTEDMGKFSRERCACGRPSPVIKELLGRSSDLIRTYRGDIVHGEFFTHLFYGQNGIRRFQVHQTSLNHLVVRYVPITKLPEEQIEQIADRIRERLGKGVTVQVEACEEIPVLSSGKYRFTISDVRRANVTGLEK